MSVYTLIDEMNGCHVGDEPAALPSRSATGGCRRDPIEDPEGRPRAARKGGQLQPRRSGAPRGRRADDRLLPVRLTAWPARGALRRSRGPGRDPAITVGVPGAGPDGGAGPADRDLRSLLVIRPGRASPVAGDRRARPRALPGAGRSK